MENNLNNQEQTLSQLECKMAERLIGMYMSRQRTIGETGDILESNTYSEDERNSQASEITRLLTETVDDDKAQIIERILNYETHVQRQEIREIDGTQTPVVYEAVISAFGGAFRTKLTSALSMFIVSKARELIN